MGVQVSVAGGRETWRQSETARLAVVSHVSCILCHRARCDNGRWIGAGTWESWGVSRSPSPFAISNSLRASDASCSFGRECARPLPTARLHVGGRSEEQGRQWHLRCILTVTD